MIRVMTVERLLEFKGKNDSTFVLLDKRGTWKKAVLQILKERLQEGYYTLCNAPVMPAVRVEEIPDTEREIQAAVKQRWERYEWDKRYYDNSVTFLAAVKAALKDKDADKALHLLKSRTGEYEEVYEWPLLNRQKDR